MRLDLGSDNVNVRQMVEPPARAVPHLPGYPDDTFSDFTHRDYRPFHAPNPTPKGIPYPILMTPQQAGGLLTKVARKSRGKVSTKSTGPKPTTTASHGRK
jgi:hypothetical protein